MMKKSDWYYTIPVKLRKRLSILLGGMQQRCYNPKMHSYPDYGGRGIKISTEWYDEVFKIRRIENFMRWALSHGYEPGLQIDRINNNGNYEPENCRFVTGLENARNKRNCKPITYNGQTMCLSEWAEKLSVPKYVLKNRLNQGWTLDRVFSTPASCKDMILTYRGKKISLSSLARKNHINRTLVRDRLKAGWTVEKAVETPASKGNTHFYTYKGETNSIKYFALKYQKRYPIMCKRIKDGMSIAQAIEGEWK